MIRKMLAMAAVAGAVLVPAAPAAAAPFCLTIAWGSFYFQYCT